MELRTFSNVVEISEHRSVSAPGAHRHATAYAAIVLQGEYTEISADGKLVVGPGDVVVHPVFHKHKNVFVTSPVSVLNLQLPASVGITLPYACLSFSELPLSQDDILLRPCDSAAIIAEQFGELDDETRLRADIDGVGLAWEKLKQPRALKINRVAAETGVSPEHLAREFRARYGLSPVEYRGEHRFRHALHRLFAGDTAAMTACKSGYSDQSHMTRDIRQRIGMTPRELIHYLGLGL